MSEKSQNKVVTLTLGHPVFFTNFSRLLPELGPLVDDDLGGVSPRGPGLVEACEERLGEGDELAGSAAAPALLREGALTVNGVGRASYHHIRTLNDTRVLLFTMYKVGLLGRP